MLLLSHRVGLEPRLCELGFLTITSDQDLIIKDDVSEKPTVAGIASYWHLSAAFLLSQAYSRFQTLPLQFPFQACFKASIGLIFEALYAG